MAESKSSQIALKKAVFCLLIIFCIRVFSGNADFNLRTRPGCERAQENALKMQKLTHHVRVSYYQLS